MPSVDLKEEDLQKVVTETVAAMRLQIDGNNVSVLAREIYSRLIPNQEEFKPGDKILWNHGYDYDKYPPCRGVVISYPVGSTKVEIEYESTLWDKPGEMQRAQVYPGQLKVMEAKA